MKAQTWGEEQFGVRKGRGGCEGGHRLDAARLTVRAPAPFPFHHVDRLVSVKLNWERILGKRTLLLVGDERSPKPSRCTFLWRKQLFGLSDLSDEIRAAASYLLEVHQPVAIGLPVPQRQ